MNNGEYTGNRKAIIAKWQEKDGTDWELCDDLVPFVGAYKRDGVRDLLAHLNKEGVKLRGVSSIYDRARAGRIWKRVKPIPQLHYLRDRLTWTYFAEVGSVLEKKGCDFEQMIEALIIGEREGMKARSVHHLLKASAQDQDFHEWQLRLASIRTQLLKLTSDYAVPRWLRWACMVFERRIKKQLTRRGMVE